MSARYKPGFTIIETMLFLAVTGVLIAAILIGTGTSINIQRYRDSVSTFKAGLEQQYSDVSTVRNEVRADAVSCDTNALITTSGTLLPRGQSECVVLGRYLTIDDTVITTSTVIGNTAVAPSYTTDINELQSYNLSLLTTSTETSQLEWGARIAWPSGGVDARTPTMPRQIALLILRSPTSGLTYTFSSNDANMSLKDIVKAGDTVPGQAQQRLCVNSDGGFEGGLAVVIGSYASTASSIQVRSNDMGDASTC
ncbi:hypothetical protein H7X69_01555 [Candidatus Saccharibacteria bacterium]|nr:hypothetical protein [Candidatus Saccharibacteria bacterium]